jgi:hypothetical protein
MLEPRVSDRLPPAPPAERMQRLRVGITGLAAVLLMVILATAIASGLRRQAAVDPATTSPKLEVAGANSEPLAQLGAAPGGADSQNKQAPAPR